MLIFQFKNCFKNLDLIGLARKTKKEEYTDPLCTENLRSALVNKKRPLFIIGGCQFSKNLEGNEGKCKNKTNGGRYLNTVNCSLLICKWWPSNKKQLS